MCGNSEKLWVAGLIAFWKVPDGHLIAMAYQSQHQRRVGQQPIPVLRLDVYWPPSTLDLTSGTIPTTISSFQPHFQRDRTASAWHALCAPACQGAGRCAQKAQHRFCTSSGVPAIKAVDASGCQQVVPLTPCDLRSPATVPAAQQNRAFPTTLYSAAVRKSGEVIEKIQAEKSWSAIAAMY
jgi:hypothetical protein